MQDRPGEDGGMRSSSSILGGLFSWISPYRHGDAPDAERGEARARFAESQDDAAHTPSKRPSAARPEALPTPPGLPRTESTSALPHWLDAPAHAPSRAAIPTSASYAPIGAPDPYAARWESPRALYQPDTSIASNPSPLAQRHTPQPHFHPRSFETPTRRAPSSNALPSASPFAPSSGRRHRPIYFGPGTSPQVSRYAPTRPSSSTAAPLASPAEPKRRRTEASPSAAIPVQYAPPPSVSAPTTPAQKPTRKRAAPETVERADEALRSIRAALGGEPPKDPEAEPGARPTRAASTMLTVLESSAPRQHTPAVPEVVNPYQTRSKTQASPRATTPKSTRARALEAARKRASTTAARDPDAPPKVSLLDMVERTAPASASSPRRSRRLQPEDEEPAQEEPASLEPPKAAWQHKPKKPSPLAMAADKDAAAAADTTSQTQEVDTSDSRPSAPSTFSSGAHTTQSTKEPARFSFGAAPSAPTAPTSKDDARAAPAATAQPEKPKPFTFGTKTDAPATDDQPKDKPTFTFGFTKPPVPSAASTSALGTSSASAAKPAAPTAGPALPAPEPNVPAPLPDKFRDVPDWAIITPPWKRTAVASACETLRQAQALPYDQLPTFAFHVPPAKADATRTGVSQSGAPAPSPATAPPSFAASSSSTKTDSKPATPSFSFGKPTEPAAQPPQPTPTFGSSSAKPSAPTSGFSFGKPASDSKAPSFSFGKPASESTTPSFSFSKPTSQESPAGFSFKPPAPQPPSTGFSFGKPSAPAPSSGFSFGKTTGAPSSGFSFGVSPATNTSSSGLFGQPKETPSSGADAPAGTTQTPATATAHDAEESAAPASSDNTLTSAGQGEEGEETKHEVRAKIWKLEGGQWQDLGVTVFRIKKSTDTGKCRVLARNAVNGNVVLNFLLYTGLKVSCEKSVLSFVGMMDAKPCSLRCKVKTAEAAESLKDALISHSA